MSTYYLLWRTHGLAPGHPLALRPSEILPAPTRPPRTIPATNTPTPAPTTTPGTAE
ncbi:MAG TPA: hypothetical protein VMR54_07320 [Thermoanaerobaculia bacterium]|nr:hypothetical protein [Thermoanaerobaculia bacterium]